MAIFGAGLDVGLALLLVAVFAKYGGIKLDGMPLNLLAVGGLAFILAGVLSTAQVGFAIPPAVGTVLNAVGAIATVVGAVLAAYSLVMRRR